MTGFTLLWAKILDSSIWINGTKEDRILWVTMMAMRDREGVVLASLVGLANRAKLTIEECKKSLKVLLSPDPDDTSKVDGGRRLREVPGGWLLVNHDLYRFSTEAKREFWKQQKAHQRAKQKVSQEYLAKEAQFNAADKRGDKVKCDEIAGEGL